MWGLLTERFVFLSGAERPRCIHVRRSTPQLKGARGKSGQPVAPSPTSTPFHPQEPKCPWEWELSSVWQRPIVKNLLLGGICVFILFDSALYLDFLLPVSACRWRKYNKMSTELRWCVLFLTNTALNLKTQRNHALNRVSILSSQNQFPFSLSPTDHPRVLWLSSGLIIRPPEYSLSSIPHIRKIMTRALSLFLLCLAFVCLTQKVRVLLLKACQGGDCTLTSISCFHLGGGWGKQAQANRRPVRRLAAASVAKREHRAIELAKVCSVADR